MVGVTLVEGWFRRIGLPIWLRPAVGGAALAGMALAYPQILGSGPGGIVSTISSSYGFVFLLGLFPAKVAASALSVVCGFPRRPFTASPFLWPFVAGPARA